MCTTYVQLMYNLHYALLIRLGIQQYVTSPSYPPLCRHTQPRIAGYVVLTHFMQHSQYRSVVGYVPSPSLVHPPLCMQQYVLHPSPCSHTQLRTAGYVVLTHFMQPSQYRSVVGYVQYTYKHTTCLPSPIRHATVCDIPLHAATLS